METLQQCFSVWPSLQQKKIKMFCVHVEFHVHSFAPIASSSLLWHLWDNYDSIFNPSHWTFMHLPPTKLLFRLESHLSQPFLTWGTAVPLLCWWLFPGLAPGIPCLELGHPELRANPPDEQRGHHLPQPLTMLFLVQVRYFYLLAEQFQFPVI